MAETEVPSVWPNDTGLAGLRATMADFGCQHQEGYR